MVQLVKCMNWTNDFAEGTFSLFAGQTLEGFQPIDFYHFYPLYFDLWLTQVCEAINNLDLETKSYQEISYLLPPPSNMRAILQKIVPTYQALENKNIDEIRTVTNFFARMLYECCPDDPFGKISNPLHTSDEAQHLSEKINFGASDVVSARKIGQLITAAGSLVHGLYNDVVTDLGWDAYGPYQISKHEQNYSFLIRHFTDLSPKGLGWSDSYLLSTKEIMVYSLYQGVEWEIKCVGCHTMAVTGSPVEGMRYHCVVADGKALTLPEIDVLIDEMSDKAEMIYKDIRAKSFEELKIMVQLQESYQLKKMFDAAGMDWRPTPEMVARISNQALVDRYLPNDKFMNTLEEYKDIFGINRFSNEVIIS
jgi:hypothetical protein